MPLLAGLAQCDSHDNDFRSQLLGTEKDSYTEEGQSRKAVEREKVESYTGLRRNLVDHKVAAFVGNQGRE